MVDMDTITFRKQLNGLTRVDMEEYFDDAEVENLYHWIGRIPLSRPKKNIVKDFSDGGMLYRSSCIPRRCICMHLMRIMVANMSKFKL